MDTDVKNIKVLIYDLDFDEFYIRKECWTINDKRKLEVSILGSLKNCQCVTCKGQLSSFFETNI